MKIKIPVLPFIGLLIVALTALITNFIIQLPSIIENTAYIVGIVLTIIGNLFQKK